MPGMMGRLMKMFKFSMNGKTKIYPTKGEKIISNLKEVEGYEIDLFEQKRKKEITFHGKNLLKGNVLFRYVILKPDIKIGIKKYNKNKWSL